MYRSTALEADTRVWCGVAICGMALLVSSPVKKWPGSIVGNRYLSYIVVPLPYVLVALPIGLAFLYVHSFGVNVAYWDQWAIVNQFDDLLAGRLSPADLWEQQNEHRIVVPRIVMLVLGILTHYNNIAEMYLTLTTFCLVLGILFLPFAKDIHYGSKPTLLLFVPVSLLLFSPRQYENWLMGFLMQFALVLLFAVLTFYSLRILGHEGAKLGAFCVALAAALAASFSSAHGLLVWPVGLLQLVITTMSNPRQKTAFIGIWSLTGAAAWLLYFRDYTNPRPGQYHLFVLTHPVNGLEYFLASLGASLSWQPQIAIIVGFVLASIIVGMISMLIGRSRRLSEYRFWLALLSYSLLVLAAITAGRSQGGADYAVTSRYAAYSIPAVISAYAILLQLVSEHTSRLVTFLLGTLSVVILLSTPASYLRGIEEGIASEVFREEAAFVLYTHESQPADILERYLCPFDCYKDLIKPGIPILERLDYNVFAEPRAHHLPPPLPSLTHRTTTASYGVRIKGFPTAPAGEPILVPREKRFIEITGWAVDANAKNTAGGVYIDIGNKLFPAFYGKTKDGFQPNYRNSGFHRAIPTSELPAGVHNLSIIVVAQDGRGYYTPGANQEEVLLEVSP
jgi:hypothetical protein